MSKSLAEFAPNGANGVKSIFGRGVYVDKNTSQAASVEFGCRRQTNYARSRLPKNCRKALKGIFGSLKRPHLRPFIGYLKLYLRLKHQAVDLVLNLAALLGTQTLHGFQPVQGGLDLISGVLHLHLRLLNLFHYCPIRE